MIAVPERHNRVGKACGHRFQSAAQMRSNFPFVFGEVTADQWQVEGPENRGVRLALQEEFKTRLQQFFGSPAFREPREIRFGHPNTMTRHRRPLNGNVPLVPRQMLNCNHPVMFAASLEYSSGARRDPRTEV